MLHFPSMRLILGRCYRDSPMRGWERGRERLPPGYCLDTTDPATWALSRADGTVMAYFSAWSATRETVERAARDDDKRRRSKRRIL
jgi:hypothetical protein